MRDRFRSFNDLLPHGTIEDAPALGIDSSKSARELRLSFRSFENNLNDTIESILEVERRHQGLKCLSL